MDVDSTAWSAAMQAHQAQIPLAGCVNRVWEVWRHYMPDRADMWDFLDCSHFYLTKMDS